MSRTTIHQQQKKQQRGVNGSMIYLCLLQMQWQPKQLENASATIPWALLNPAEHQLQQSKRYRNVPQAMQTHTHTCFQPHT
jgi:hypothetical protein